MISIAKPYIGSEEIKAVIDVMRSGMIASGKKVTAFENEFADMCGTKYAIATNNGTSALHSALLAGGIKPGDEVIIPDFTFFATASSISMCGATPVFCDIKRDNYNIDIQKIESLITPKTKAIIGVHLFGHIIDHIDRIHNICSDHNLLFIEDAAQAHGACISHDFYDKHLAGKYAGNIGDMGCFSLYATKNIMCGEGGMITTNSQSYADKIRRIINHGQSDKYLHTELGYNYRMTDLSAAIGLSQLKRLNDITYARQSNAIYYTKHLIGVNGLNLPSPSYTDHVFHQFVIRVDEDFPMTRDELVSHLISNNIGTAIHYPIPLHKQPYYFKDTCIDPCPIASEVASSVLSLPVHPLLKHKDLAFICDVIKKI